MILLRIPRASVRALTALAVGGCVALLCLALSGCGPSGVADRAADACIERGGVPRIEYPQKWARYAGCDPPPACPPCEPGQFRPDYYPPAEAPEGGAP